MKKFKLYLDTSVLNFALTNDPSLTVHKTATLNLLEQIKQEKFDCYISELVIAEINRAPKEKAELLHSLVSKLNLKALPIDDQTKELADKYVDEKLFPVKYSDDALHIAIASVNNLDVVVSWNFQHMVKLKTKIGVVAVNNLLGYKPIEVVSPEEVI
ncbi:MAG: PIN domain-containing protein [Candidatus Omnitrophota bacterium]